MVKLTLTGLIAFGLLAQSNAQPAIYQNQSLQIPQAVALGQDGPAYFADVKLSTNPDGSLSVVDATLQNLVMVDSVDVLLLESFPVQVSITVAGNKSVPCVELQPVAVSREGDLFTVVIAETSLGPAETCIAVLDPFELSVALDVLGLSAGTYRVNVNGTEAQFSLDVDNVGPG